MATADWFKKLVVPMADKVVYASHAYVSLKSTVNELGERLIDFDGPSRGPADDRLRQVAALIRPMTAEGLELVRVGGNHDGGYVMANDFTVGGAISVGVGPDVTWDQAVAARGIPVAMFDPTVRKLPDSVAQGRFFKVGIGGAEPIPGYRTLPGLVELAGFSRNSDLLLKVDVEGAEWESIAALEGSDLEQYRQMAFEFHGLKGLKNAKQGELITAVLEKLARNHIPIHVHANNYDELVRFDRNWFPNSVEVTYVRKDVLGQPVPAAKIASELDRPCDPRVSEIPLEAMTLLGP